MVIAEEKYQYRWTSVINVVDGEMNVRRHLGPRTVPA